MRDDQIYQYQSYQDLHGEKSKIRCLTYISLKIVMIKKT